MAMDFALELLKENNFLHVFPQGRVVEDPDLNQDISALNKMSHADQMKQVTLRDGDYHKDYQLKWGLARIILDLLFTDPSPEKHVLVLPFFHIGMHHVLPNTTPYVPQVGQLVTVSVRENGPIRFDVEFVNQVCCKGNAALPIKEKRKLIMAFLEDELKALKLKSIKFRHSVLN